MPWTGCWRSKSIDRSVRRRAPPPDRSYWRIARTQVHANLYSLALEAAKKGEDLTETKFYLAFGLAGIAIASMVRTLSEASPRLKSKPTEE